MIWGRSRRGTAASGAVGGQAALVAMRMARSIATQHISREYTKFLRPPRVSQMPSSGWSQFSQTQSTSCDSSSQRSLAMGSPHLL